MTTTHEVEIGRILDRDLPHLNPIDRATAVAELADYLDRLIQGQDDALCAILKDRDDPRARGEIPLSRAREALRTAPPALHLPQPRRPLVRETADGSWVPDRHGSAS